MSSAVRVEDALQDHLMFLNDRKYMRKVIQSAKAFSEGCSEGIEAKSKELLNQDYKDEQSNIKVPVSRVGPIDEDLKFGRRKRTAYLFKWLLIGLLL